MKVNFSKNNTSFQKNALFNCIVKRKGTNEKANATLYLYKKQNPNDMEEIANSNLPIQIKSNFLNLYYANNSRFYALKTDNSGEFVSFAQVSKHFIQDEGKYRGTISTIEEFNTNKEFIDPELPLLSQITKDAINSEDNFIITSFRTDEAPYFKSASFSKTKYDNWALPEKRYTNLIDRAEKRNQIEYLC